MSMTGAHYPLHQHDASAYEPGSPAWIEAKIRDIQARQQAGLLPQRHDTGKIATAPMSAREVRLRKELSERDTVQDLSGEVSKAIRAIAEAREARQAQDDLHVADLPTFLGHDGENLRVQEIFARSQPLPDDSWLNAPPPVNVAHVEFWTSIDERIQPPALVPMDTSALASADKTAVTPNPLGVTPEDEQVAEDESPTEMTERARADKQFKQAISGLLESEG